VSDAGGLGVHSVSHTIVCARLWTPNQLVTKTAPVQDEDSLRSDIDGLYLAQLQSCLVPCLNMQAFCVCVCVCVCVCGVCVQECIGKNLVQTAHHKTSTQQAGT